MCVGVLLLWGGFVFWIELGRKDADENIEATKKSQKIRSTKKTKKRRELSALPGIFWGEGRSQKLAEEELPKHFESLKKIHQPIQAPKPGDWLASHYEKGQSVQRYKKENPIRPTKKRRFIYVWPLGGFTRTQHEIIMLTAEYLKLYFCLPVKVMKTIPLSRIPWNARRKHPRWGMQQLWVGYIIKDLLIPNLPKDAMASIAFTAQDLFPGDGWNFVYGYALVQKRVGVWSVYRNGNPDASKAAYQLFLRRTLKIATHELGHIFTIEHCIGYECNMNGVNHREESDKKPLHLCPLCLHKLTWNTRCDPVERYKKLEAFATRHKLRSLRQFYQRSRKLMQNKK